MGTESFGREYGDPLLFDQQPLEAQATVDACVAAFEATGDRRWIDEAMRAYGWFLGQNDLDMPLASSADGGCFDGLMPTGFNRNQGAESILALQLAGRAPFLGFQSAAKAWQGRRAPSPSLAGAGHGPAAARRNGPMDLFTHSLKLHADPSRVVVQALPHRLGCQHPGPEPQRAAGGRSAGDVAERGGEPARRSC